MKDKIIIASGQGFWGDLLEAPVQQVTKGKIDYLVMDYLAEVTMSILQKQKNRNPKLGYASDLPDLIQRILPTCIDKDIKIITNGGGVNPEECANVIIENAKKLDIKKLKIAVILGDDIKDRLDEIIGAGSELNNMETGESIKTITDRIVSANVYFVAIPIVEALSQDADIVIASPYMKGGKTTKIPFHRLLLSKTLNKLMRWTSGIDIHSFTGMARAYRKEFLNRAAEHWPKKSSKITI